MLTIKAAHKDWIDSIKHHTASIAKGYDHLTREEDYDLSETPKEKVIELLTTYENTRFEGVTSYESEDADCYLIVVRPLNDEERLQRHESDSNCIGYATRRLQKACQRSDENAHQIEAYLSHHGIIVEGIND